MAKEGRIEGRLSNDGRHYLLIQRGEVKQSIPIAEAQAHPTLRATIQRNSWEALP